MSRQIGDRDRENREMAQTLSLYMIDRFLEISGIGALPRSDIQVALKTQAQDVAEYLCANFELWVAKDGVFPSDAEIARTRGWDEKWVSRRRVEAKIAIASLLAFHYFD